MNSEIFYDVKRLGAYCVPTVSSISVGEVGVVQPQTPRKGYTVRIFANLLEE